MVVSKDVSKIAAGSKTLGPCQAFRIDSETSESQSSFLELGFPSVYCFFGDRVEEWIEAQMREGAAMPLRNRSGIWHYHFMFDGKRYGKTTALAATRRNETAARGQETEHRQALRGGRSKPAAF
jgi:hypothetical protein